MVVGCINLIFSHFNWLQRARWVFKSSTGGKRFKYLILLVRQKPARHSLLQQCVFWQKKNEMFVNCRSQSDNNFQTNLLRLTTSQMPRHSSNAIIIRCSSTAQRVLFTARQILFMRKLHACTGEMPFGFCWKFRWQKVCAKKMDLPINWRNKKEPDQRKRTFFQVQWSPNYPYK